MAKPLPGPEIQTIDEVVRDHVLAVVKAHPDVPDYRLAVELGVSPSTLCRMLQDWTESDEELVRDRR